MRLNERMRAQGKSGADLARATGLGEVAISFIRRGSVLPTPKDMAVICRELDCGPAALYDPAELDFELDGEKRPFPAPMQETGRVIGKARFWPDEGALNFFNPLVLIKTGRRGNTRGNASRGGGERRARFRGPAASRRVGCGLCGGCVLFGRLRRVQPAAVCGAGCVRDSSRTIRAGQAPAYAGLRMTRMKLYAG